MQPHGMNDERPLPFGVFDLDAQLVSDPGPPLRIRCFVHGCDEMLVPPARKAQGETCPVHGIRAHPSSTFSYADVRRNTIVSGDLLANRIVGHPFKFESHRLGAEKSEDTLTFNVLRSFQEAGCLNYVARLITGLDHEDEPRLFLWGIEMTNDSLVPWDLLIAARERFEPRLPVKRPKTEPDAALLLERAYLVLVEAKFNSPNTFYSDGPRKDKQSLTKNELLNIYSDLSLRYLDREQAIAAECVFYQLWRNVVFAEFMAQLAPKGTVAYFANLTKRGFENDSFGHFQNMMRPEFAGRISHISWEDLFTIAGLSGGRTGPDARVPADQDGQPPASFQLRPVVVVESRHIESSSHTGQPTSGLAHFFPCPKGDRHVARSFDPDQGPRPHGDHRRLFPVGPAHAEPGHRPTVQCRGHGPDHFDSLAGSTLP